ncbi:MAG: PBP1A family penicillin-binding protein [Eubacteriales bacterium]|nr:PBP1A family penicillin-binding protein [Eubacteriales bacterium]
MKKARKSLNPNVLKFIKIFSIAFCAIIVVCFLILIGAITGIIDTTANLDLDRFQLKLTSYIYYIDPETGDEVEYAGLFSDENRKWVDIESIPEVMQDAIVSIEDERFYDHIGVDFLSTGKAVFLHLLGMDTRGASTITQQLVKNITHYDEVSVTRKAVEILRALNVERKWTKDQILEMYLNTIYLSNGCNGVAAASEYYFGKDISQVSTAEAALLAGITQYPSLYDPIHSFKASKEKQELVLSKMLQLGKLSKTEYNDALKEELVIQKGDVLTRTPSVYSYFSDMIIDNVSQKLVEEKGYSKAAATALLFNGGLKIYATIDPNVQDSLEKVFTDTSNFPQTNQKVPPQSAMIVMDPQNGEIKGIVGGVGVKNQRRTLNRATQAYRQPGSTMKPIGVYAPAIEKGVIGTDTHIVDQPININGWKPKNYGQKYYGDVSIKYAVAQSLNSVAVQVLQQVGVDYSYKFLTEKLGITTLVDSRKEDHGYVSDKNLSSLALGGLTDGVSLLEITAAYATFANNGKYHEPHAYTKVLGNDGTVLLEYSDDESRKAMSANTAYSMVSLLKGVVQGGTGSSANFRGDLDICGKTGTTDKDMDRWFVGFTPYYVAASWYGYDIPKSIAGVSGNPAIPAWKKVMTEIHKDLPAKRFEVPKGYNRTVTDLSYYCTESKAIANQGCFADGTAVMGVPENDDICTIHGAVSVDTSTNMLATENCPKESVTTIYYKSSDVSDGLIHSSDGNFTNKYCNIHGSVSTDQGGIPSNNTQSNTNQKPPSNEVSDAPVVMID